ncbi:MAG: sterol desaturase family protein [Acidimicrobiales bacterium]
MDAATSGEVKSTDLQTKRQVARVFVAYASPRTILSAVAIAITVRVLLWGWSYADVVVVAATLALTGIVEWVIHEHLLHAPEDSVTTRRLGTGIGHRRHHLDPADLEWVLLGGLDAAVFVVLLALFTALWAVPLLWLLGTPILLPYLSALTAAYLALANYEWTHLLVHTRYRPRTPYYRRLRRNHGLHHYRNEHYWLGVTSNLGDRLLRTYPDNKTQVPLSATARTLDQIPD